MGIKDEFTKKEEDLDPVQLQQAQGLAGILTGIRQFSYFFIRSATVAIILYFMMMYNLPIFLLAIYGIFGFFYILFNLRDYLRGDI